MVVNTVVHGRASVTLDARHPLLAQRTGRGVAVGVLDSGVNPYNPHVGRVADALAFRDDGTSHADALDRLGHGTAVFAAIQEKAPDADLHVLKVFDTALSTTARAIAAAIDAAAERGLRIVNLSLGTVRPHHVTLLEQAVQRAHARGTIVVSAAEHDGEPWYPGSLPLVAGVTLDWSCARDALVIDAHPDGSAAFRACGFPRPVPGVPPERNIKGVSFAVANVTGLLACLLEDRPDLDSVHAIVRLVSGSRSDRGGA